MQNYELKNIETRIIIDKFYKEVYFKVTKACIKLQNQCANLQKILKYRHFIEEFADNLFDTCQKLGRCHSCYFLKISDSSGALAITNVAK